MILGTEWQKKAGCPNSIKVCLPPPVLLQYYRSQLLLVSACLESLSREKASVFSQGGEGTDAQACTLGKEMLGSSCFSKSSYHELPPSPQCTWRCPFLSLWGWRRANTAASWPALLQAQESAVPRLLRHSLRVTCFLASYVSCPSIPSHYLSLCFPLL